MKRSLRNISKLAMITGCVLMFANTMANAAPLVYDVNSPAIRTESSATNKIRLEGDVNFNSYDQLINLSLRNTDVQQVLRMFADKAGLNIVFHSSATGTVTLDLVDVTLENAFKMVMQMTNLTYVIKDKTMMVVSVNQAQNLNITKDNIYILPVKYADSIYLADFLNKNIFMLNAPGLSYGPIVTTNSERNELLIFGSENDYLMAKKIVDKFDIKPTLTTYRVNHTTPYEMAKMVCETLFSLPYEGQKSAGRGASSSLTANLKIEKRPGEPVDGALGVGSIACTLKSSVTANNLTSYQAKPTMTLYVQPELGTLTLVGGTSQQIEMVNDFIVQNDRKQPQAFLEISIITLNESGSREFNNQWMYDGKHLKINFNSDGAITTPIIWHGSHSGTNGLRQTISYLIENQKGRMLANPKIIITNGKKSVVDLTRDYIKDATVQFTSSGLSSSSSQVQKTYNIEEDAGIKVEILPFISPDGYVSLNIKPEYAEVYQQYNELLVPNEPSSEYTAATLLQRNNLDLKNVRIKDEETLLIGGMITNEEINKTSKVPILGDLPFIGFLFRNQSKKMEKREMLIMITPRIIKDTEDVADL